MFECRFNKPVQQIIWFRKHKSNIEHLFPTHKYQIESLNNNIIHRLFIKDLNLHDSGYYAVTNQTIVSLAKLTVKQSNPRFIEFLNDTQIHMLFFHVKLICHVKLFGFTKAKKYVGTLLNML